MKPLNTTLLLAVFLGLATTAETLAAQADTPATSLPSHALPVPIVRQSTHYSCGAASLLSLLYYWQAFDGPESDLFPEIGTDQATGTKPQGIVHGAKKHGLEASSKENVSLEDLRDALKRKEPVILDIQAWPDDIRTSTIPWSQRWEDGHYLVLIGMDKTNAYVMDPSVPTGYAFIPLPELLERWHDYEDKPGGGVWRYHQLAIFVKGKEPLRTYPGPLIHVL